MTISRMTVLVVGATGSIGYLVVEEALRQGHAVRALVRTPGKARRLPPKTLVVPGDVTRPNTLPAAVDGVDAVVFTLVSDGAGKEGLRVSITAACATSWVRWVRGQRASR